jgi:hypothetical protein
MSSVCRTRIARSHRTNSWHRTDMLHLHFVKLVWLRLFSAKAHRTLHQWIWYDFHLAMDPLSLPFACSGMERRKMEFHHTQTPFSITAMIWRTVRTLSGTDQWIAWLNQCQSNILSSRHFFAIVRLSIRPTLFLERPASVNCEKIWFGFSSSGCSARSTLANAYIKKR